MSSSIANNLTKWNDEQLHEHEDNDDELFEKKSVERRHCTKARKEAEHQMAEEVVRRKAEEEAKQKVEVEAQRRTEAEAKACAEEVAWAQSSVLGPPKGKQLKVAASGTAEDTELCEQPGDMQSSRWRKREEAMLPQAGKKKVWTKSPVVDDKEEDTEDCKAKENCDVLGALVEVLSVVVGEMQNMATDRRCMAAESCAQMERMLGTLEEIRGCLDPEFTLEELEEWSEEDFEEEEVVEAAKEKEALKGHNKEEVEVDKSV
ncbi:hypothetical protein PAXRUDRAFT_17291 [Paxillus rubicundulus Ve08.2h10]|uniref:Uncharacterized protein n=1 Tax=Paxillus rubicundulus Ve08.2h10 TaxID=930991 RepID=A0A0D0D2I3_9AGAM|nr:hypothetical protein PAXRUDRAFT_17291 [Paxillus rubicundulus Ve08.2h10]